MMTIVYTSNTGTTKQYAEILSEKTGLLVYSFEQAKNKLPKDSEIIYLGWLMASKVQGYEKASKLYKIKAVCAVCMGSTGSQIKKIREKNSIPETIPVFSMQGGFDINQLHGLYKMMMKVMVKTVGKQLKEKVDRTKEEEDMIEMMEHGANHVSIENMKDLLEWYKGID